MLNDILQVVVALILIALMGVIGYSIYNKEAQTFFSDLTKPVVIKKSVKLIDGTYGFDKQTAVINTTDPTLGNYRAIIPSINQSGGIEYSYNFWLYFKNDNISGDKTIPLFLKGSNQQIIYDSKYNCHTSAGWYLVKNPLVRVNILSGQLSGIVSEFNTIKSPDAVRSSPETPDCVNTDINIKDKNLFGMYGLQGRSDMDESWSMVTLVIRETNPSSDIMFRNEAIVKMYLNGYEYVNKSADAYYTGDNVTTAMRDNSGNFYINPITDQNNGGIAIADLTYFNYALTNEEILSLHKSGFNKTTAAIPQQIDFNEFGNYNTTEIDPEKSNVINPLSVRD